MRWAQRGAARAVLPVCVLAVAGCGGGDADAGTPLADSPPVILVTDSTDGLGRELALRLASTGAHLIIHGRTVERGREVVAEIEAGGGAGSASFHRADFASLDEVRELARAVRRDHDRLDVLVKTPGSVPAPRDTTA